MTDRHNSELYKIFNNAINMIVARTPEEIREDMRNLIGSIYNSKDGNKSIANLDNFIKNYENKPCIIAAGEWIVFIDRDASGKAGILSTVYSQIYSPRKKIDKKYRVIYVVSSVGTEYEKKKESKQFSPKITKYRSIAKDITEKYIDKFISFEILFYNELLYDQAQFILSVKDVKIFSEEEDVKKLINENLFTETQIHRLIVDDPFSRYYGLKIGDIVRCKRKNQSNAGGLDIISFIRVIDDIE